MLARTWRCGECGAVLLDPAGAEAHFQGHPVPTEAVLAPKCKHAPLVVDVTPDRVYLWASEADLADARLGLHRGWTPRGTPSAIRDVVERENHADLQTPGWYYPHTRRGAVALDALYHEIVRARHAGGARSLLRLRETSAGAMPRASPAMRERRRARRAQLAAVTELASGIVAGVVGSNLMYMCTSYILYEGCVERGFGLPGFVALFGGVCVGLYGIGSLLSSFAKPAPEMPEGWRPGGPQVDPLIQRGAERTASILWAGMLMAALVAIEALPIYNLVVLTSSGPNPTFNLGVFLGDMLVFGIADVIIVFFIVTYSSNN